MSLKNYSCGGVLSFKRKLTITTRAVKEKRIREIRAI